MKNFHIWVKNKETGSALIYLLFIISFVAIVGSIMLTTVTQGQRNIVKNEKALSHFYRAEGALKIAQAEFEDLKSIITEQEFIDYLNQFSPPSPYRQYSIGGQQTIINASMTKDTVTETVTNLQTGEETEVETQIFTIKLFDPQNSNTEKTTYRELIFSFVGEGGGGPPPPGGECGLLPCPPDENGNPNTSIEDVIRDSSRGYTYVDGGYPLIFETGSDVAQYPQIPTPGQATPEYIVIPESIGTVNYSPNDGVQYIAEQGIGIGAELIAKATGDINLTSNSGFIFIDGATLEAGTAAFASIYLNAGTYIRARGTTFIAKRDINLTARDYIDIDGAYFETNVVVCPRDIEVRGTPASNSRGGIVRGTNCP